MKSLWPPSLVVGIGIGALLGAGTIGLLATRQGGDVAAAPLTQSSNRCVDPGPVTTLLIRVDEIGAQEARGSVGLRYTVLTNTANQSVSGIVDLERSLTADQINQRLVAAASRWVQTTCGAGVGADVAVILFGAASSVTTLPGSPPATLPPMPT